MIQEAPFWMGLKSYFYVICINPIAHAIISILVIGFVSLKNHVISLTSARAGRHFDTCNTASLINQSFDFGALSLLSLLVEWDLFCPEKRKKKRFEKYFTIAVEREGIKISYFHRRWAEWFLYYSSWRTDKLLYKNSFSVFLLSLICCAAVCVLFLTPLIKIIRNFETSTTGSWPACHYGCLREVAKNERSVGVAWGDSFSSA